jgi:hypothetical protein
MSQYPNPPPPQWQGQWQPPPPPPGRPPGPRAGVWIAVTGGVLVLLLGVFAVTAFAAPGFLVDDSDDSSSASEPRSREEDEGGPGGRPEVPISPPNASAPESEPDDPEEQDEPESAAPAGDPTGFAQEYLARVAAGDAAGVDEAMCADDQEWQYEEAVSQGRALGLSEPRPDSSAPGGILADLTGPEGTVDGRITVVPDDADGWCVETFYVF